MFTERQSNLPQQLLLEGVSWQKYEQFLQLLGDDFPNLRLKYLEGQLQLVSPSRDHELIKRNLGRLLEVYLEEMRIPFWGLGSTTFRREAKARGIEPDECYCFYEEKPYPDLAIEVVITSGGLNSLAIDEGLGVPEVWFWQGGQLVIYGLAESGYCQRDNSPQLPDLPISQLMQQAASSNPLEAVLAFRQVLRGGESG
ncbi:Uma2 family endonuclease [Geitlerinema sp. P-1104]|uniref:Uma2 family endonuclease n=1 Tax=Geitlerinema sp. P-1104 TaxID=2546230 RepID=UPI00147685B8|nr:Uma2 family endonuclease [Geitlerinema sp. P-1104]NMG60184.1 Uma2 family endonuclease [Geitlerinema sp. P-1104]